MAIPNSKLTPLPRNFKELLVKKMRPLDLSEVDNWTSEQLKSWRTSDPRVSQSVLGAAVGVSPSLISQNESKDMPTKALRQRIRNCAEAFRVDPFYTYIDPETGKTPEEELFEAVGSTKRVMNKWAPMIGKGVLDLKFETFLVENRNIVAAIYRRSLQLSIAAANRRNHAQQS